MTLKKKLLADQEAKQEGASEREVFDVGGHLPPTPGHRGTGHHPSARSGRARYFTPAQIASANLGLKISIGEIIKAKETKEENSMMETIGATSADMGSGSLETALKNAKEQLQKHKAAELGHRMEALRYEKIVESLEQTVRLANAPRADLKSLLPVSSNGAGMETTGKNKPRGFWREKSKEVVVTAPISLTPVRFVDEMQRNFPDTARGNFQQVLYQGLKQGWLYKDSQGFVRYRDLEHKEGGE